jgi:hypothetical protein
MYVFTTYIKEKHEVKHLSVEYVSMKNMYIVPGKVIQLNERRGGPQVAHVLYVFVLFP